MDINNIQNRSNDEQSRYCRTIYKEDDQKVVNNYRCNQTFSTSNLWKIRKTKREFVISTGISTN
jgi:hypothetical protein